MQRDYFLNKAYCQFGIVSNTISPNNISQKLGLFPDKSFNKGEESVSRHSGSILTKPHNLWAINSSTLVSEKENFSPHIKHLQSVLEAKIQILKDLKKDSEYELIFSFWIETDNAGIGIDLSEEEVSFINSCSNRVHFSLLTTDEINE
ncbi:MAG: DUF4279 domain-containing protein [Bacteroidota bacterium]